VFDRVKIYLWVGSVRRIWNESGKSVWASSCDRLLEEPCRHSRRQYSTVHLQYSLSGNFI